MRIAALALALGLACASLARASDLPPLPEATASDRMAEQPRVLVREFRFAGNQSIASEELERAAAPWKGRELGAAELLEVRAAIAQRYHEAGFPGAEVALPDQRIRDGVVELRVAEGRLAEVNVHAPRGAGWVRRRLERVTRGVLDVKALQDELALLQQAPWVERVDALLAPAGEPGSTRLDVQLAERPAFYTALRLANDRTPAIGSLTREVEVGHENLTGRGDVASGRLGQTEGLLEWQLDYRAPLGASDFSFALGAERSRADVVESPFDDLDIRSYSTSWRAELGWSALQAPSSSLVLSLGGELVRSETELAGLDFWPGTDEGEANATVLHLGQDYARRADSWALSARSVFSLGIDALDATDLSRDALGEELGDGRFRLWLGQVYFVQRLSPAAGGIELVARGVLQLSADPLMAILRIPIGGSGSVRGYRSNELLRDSGAIASAELRVPLWTGRDAGLWLAPFADFGHGWNRHGSSDVETIASVGLGLRARWRSLELSAYYGHPLRDLPRERTDLSDRGIHLELRARAF
jgi:hemolysin activation/secretion protein